MDTAEHLRRHSRRVVPRLDERPCGVNALRSVSFSYRQDRKRQAFQERKAAHEARRAERFRDWRRRGVLDAMRARGLGDIADDYAAEMAGID